MTDAERIRQLEAENAELRARLESLPDEVVEYLRSVRVLVSAACEVMK